MDSIYSCLKCSRFDYQITETFYLRQHFLFMGEFTLTVVILNTYVTGGNNCLVVIKSIYGGEGGRGTQLLLLYEFRFEKKE